MYSSEFSLSLVSNAKSSSNSRGMETRTHFVLNFNIKYLQFLNFFLNIWDNIKTFRCQNTHELVFRNLQHFQLGKLFRCLQIGNATLGYISEYIIKVRESLGFFCMQRGLVIYTLQADTCFCILTNVIHTLWLHVYLHACVTKFWVLVRMYATMHMYLYICICNLYLASPALNFPSPCFQALSSLQILKELKRGKI